jgi:ATP-dependent Lon protease
MWPCASWPATNMRGAIINLNGPPGVGKTSIATSVARAMGREMVRISLGGVRDEAEIRGHRRTYIGAIPGADHSRSARRQDAQPGHRAGRDRQGRHRLARRPGVGAAGSAGPGTKHSFTDHYLEVPFDLSQVIFITTSNQLSTIPAALLDRMETITMPGYIEDEKQAIARAVPAEEAAGGHGIARRGH